MPQRNVKERVTEQFRRAADDAAHIAQAEQPRIEPAIGSATQLPLPPAPGLTLDDVRCEFGDRWDIAAIAQGYRAILRETGGHAPVVLYGRTSAELAESIRMAQVPS